jgi:bacterioferritin-associated ferredoxin
MRELRDHLQVGTECGKCCKETYKLLNHTLKEQASIDIDYHLKSTS